MRIKISDYVDVRLKAHALGLNAPTGLAILPRNIAEATTADELLHESSAIALRSLFRQHNIEETRIEKEGQKIPVLQENEFSLILPIIFVSASLLSQNPHALAIALNIIANYATDFFKCIPGSKKVVLDIVVENKSGRGSKRLHYEGPREGLEETEKMARKVFDD